MRSGAALATGNGGASSQRAGLVPGNLGLSGYWRRAEPAVIAMIAVVVVRLHEFFPPLRFIKPVFTLSVLGFVLLWWYTAPAVRSGVAKHGLSRMVFVYFGTVCLSIPFALWHGGAASTAQSLLPAVLLFASFQLVRPTRETLDRLEFAFLGLVLFFAWYLQAFGSSRGGRLVSVSGMFDSNNAASVFALTLPMAIVILMRMRGATRKAAAGFAILSLVAGTIATGSRGGTLAMLAGLIVLIAGLNSAKAGLVLYFAVLGGGAAWVVAPPAFKNRLSTLTHLDNDYNMTDTTGRKAVWRRGRLYIREHPVFGVGAGNFFVAEGEYNAETGNTGKWSAAHNAYIQAFAELGMVGGTAFIAMLLTAGIIARSLWRSQNRPRGPPAMHRPELLAGLAAYCVGAVFLSHAYFNPLFGLLGLIALSQRIRDAERASATGAIPVDRVQPAMAVRSGERGGFTLSTAPAVHAPRVSFRTRGGLS